MNVIDYLKNNEVLDYSLDFNNRSLTLYIYDKNLMNFFDDFLNFYDYNYHRYTNIIYIDFSPVGAIFLQFENDLEKYYMEILSEI